MTSLETTTYNNPALQACIEQMRGFVRQLESDASDLEGRTNQLMQGHWDGSSGEQYNGNAQRMQGRLAGIETAVGNLHGKVSDGAQELMDADRRGAAGQQAS